VDRTLLAPGLEISRVLTGLWQIADMERDGGAVDPEVAADAMEPYVEAGFTTFDMADHYGSAEVVVGAYRSRGRNARRVQLFTKWVPKPGPVHEEHVRAAVERALERMRTDAVDLMQFHAWSYDDPSWLDALFHLEELREEGLIRNLGLTNVDAAHLAMALHSGIRVVSNQVCYSLLDRRPARALEAVCLEHGVKLLGYGTVAGGLLTEEWLARPEPDAGDLPPILPNTDAVQMGRVEAGVGVHVLPRRLQPVAVLVSGKVVLHQEAGDKSEVPRAPVWPDRDRHGGKRPPAKA